MGSSVPALGVFPVRTTTPRRDCVGTALELDTRGPEDDITTALVLLLPAVLEDVPATEDAVPLDTSTLVDDPVTPEDTWLDEPPREEDALELDRATDALEPPPDDDDDDDDAVLRVTHEPSAHAWSVAQSASAAQSAAGDGHPITPKNTTADAAADQRIMKTPFGHFTRRIPMPTAS